jgi:hypothetical protein
MSAQTVGLLENEATALPQPHRIDYALICHSSLYAPPCSRKALALSRRLSSRSEWEYHSARNCLAGALEGWRRSVVDGFHRLWHGTWKDTRFLGAPTWECPLDL